MSLERLLDLSEPPSDAETLYAQLEFPPPLEARPYVYINMAATVDGKIVLGEAGGPAAGLGGPTDQVLFRRLQQHCDAAIIGGSTLRASQVIYPPRIARYVVTGQGDIPLTNRFFMDAPNRAYVLAPESLPSRAREQIEIGAHLYQIGRNEVDLVAALQWMRSEHGVKTLLCEGGGTLNDVLLRNGLVDELFLTLAAKIKGGAHLPTPVGGIGFTPGEYLPLHLLSVYRDEDEMYFRYRVSTRTERFSRGVT